MQLDSETEIGGDLLQLPGMEFKAEASKPKLTTAEDYEDSSDDDVYPYAVLYDRNSTGEEPGQTFIDLANLAVEAFIERSVNFHEGKLLELVKVSSVDSNGVRLTLAMTADLKGNVKPQREEGDPTLEAIVWYGGDVTQASVLTVGFWHREVETDDDVESIKSEPEAEAEPEIESDEEVVDVNEPFLTEFAELALADFNDFNPHIPYQLMSLLKVTRLCLGRDIAYTIRMNAKLKFPHDAKSNAPEQTFRAEICHPICHPSDAIVLRIAIVDPS